MSSDHTLPSSQSEVSRLFDSISSHLYWFESILKGYQQELVKTPQVKHFLDSIPDRRKIDLLQEFEVFLKALDTFDRHVSRVHRDGVRSYPITRFSDLELHEAEKLSVINSRFNEIEDVINQRMKSLNEKIREESLNEAPPLCDKEFLVKVQASLRQIAPAFRDDSDNEVARYEITPREDELGNPKLYWPKEGWPHGYEFDGMAHDEFMHELRYYGRPQMNAVDLRDILRIGRVDLDVVVYYQFSYNLEKGEWSKSWDEEEGAAATPS